MKVYANDLRLLLTHTEALHVTGIRMVLSRPGRKCIRQQSCGVDRVQKTMFFSRQLV